MKRIIFILGLFFFSFAYSQYSDELIELKKPLDTIDYADSGIIGIAGDESEIFNQFSKISKIATDKELYLLAKYGSNGLRAFSSIELLNRNSEYFYKIYMRYLNNPLKVLYISGCVGEYYNISDLIRLKLETVKYVVEEEKNLRDKYKSDLKAIKYIDDYKLSWDENKYTEAIERLDLIDMNFKKHGAVYYED